MLVNKLSLSFKKPKQDVCLAPADINRIEQKAKSNRDIFSDSHKTSAENMAGDLQSRIRGAGVDFEENKPYQNGSDSRHINWRTFARTQQLFVNIYNEDKRPSTYIVLDQRSKMYFGTRKQLKVKQALNIAIYSAFNAMHKQQNVSGVQILTQPRWHSTYSGITSISSFVATINQPLIVNDDITAEPALNDILVQLQLGEGADLVIISDMHDMNNETVSILFALSQKYSVKVIQIMDPIELKIPEKGFYNISESPRSPVLAINFNKKISENYNHTIVNSFNTCRQQCSNMGIIFRQILTSDNPFSESA